jgi:flagellar hook protein FlgE
MSLFGALFTGVSGLEAQASATSMISNNIANVDTIGYKSSTAAFYSLVTATNSGGEYSPGTVAVNQVQNVSLQGAIQQTSSSTDAAISGNGFFVVKANTDDSSGFLYTRSGSFTENSSGLLVNSASNVLYGWPLDANGNIPSNSGDLASLKPVDVAFLGGLTRPTTTADMALNVNSSADDQTLASAQSGTSDFSRGITVYDSLGSPQVLTMNLTKVYGPQATDAGTVDSLLTTTNLTSDLGVNAGDQFSISVDGTSVGTFSVTDATHSAPPGTTGVATVGDIVNAINNLPANSPTAQVQAYIGNDGELVVQRTDFTGGATQSISMTNGTNPLTNLPSSALSSLGLTSGTFTSNDLSNETATADGSLTGITAGEAMTGGSPGLNFTAGQTISVQTEDGTTATYTVAAGDTVQTMLDYFNGAGVPPSGVTGLTAAIGPNGELQISHTTTGSASLTLGGTGDVTQFGLEDTTYSSPGPFSNGSAADSPAYSSGDFPQLQSLPGSPNYNSRGWWEVQITKPDGSTQTEGLINFNSDGSLNAITDSSGDANVALNQINWGNGSSLQNISLNIGQFNQYAGDYNVISTDQNGAALGLRTGVEIDTNGYVVAQFSNGASTNLYKLPLATFADEDGLDAQSGTNYSQDDASGEVNLREAGTGGAGTLATDSIESSNVDLAGEFANLIVAQRAYSANTKVITTVDQMTQDLLQIQ